MSANHNLEELLNSLPHQQFTGTITIKAQDDKQWELYFYLGKFLWIEGGDRPNRSWHRHMKQHFPNVDLELLVWDASLLALKEDKDVKHLKYYCLVALLQNNKVKPELIVAFIENKTKEVFFDILQQEHKQALQYLKQNYSAHQILKAGFNLSLAKIDIEQIMFEAQQQWLDWKYKGLASCSPNLAPFLRNYHELKEKTPDIIFKNMSRLINGKHTVRDLAIKMDRDLPEVARGLLPYFFKGYLRFKEIPDIPDIVISNSTLFEAK